MVSLPDSMMAVSRERELFDRCIALPTTARRSYLRDACGEDTALERRMLRLLDAHEAAVSLSLSDRTPLDDPDQIGPYRVLERIGEGGMGTVYAAEQTAPIRRRVALKVIKPGMDSREVIARFETERQVLALMNHPNVASILDAGATDQGRPYFVMEYVPGAPITEFLDKHRSTLSERIELFLSVCDGVHHAHQKGIIHRDLKPSNVLVTIEGDRAIPKIIDFGVAKATQLPLGGPSHHTRTGAVIGTPEYMSPEQAEMSGLDIDTRSDVYALGMMLYEILVGSSPFDVQALRALPVEEIRRRVRDADLPRPSARVPETRWSAEFEAPAHRRQLRGDLDAIVMKAAERNRTRRYESAAALADDLRRYLTGQPVLAAPDRVAYRAAKFVSRHRTTVGAAIVAVGLLVVYGVTVTVQNRRVETALRQAVVEADRAEQVTGFLIDLFEADVPGGDATIQRILEKGFTEALALGGQPAVEAQALTVLARAHRRLGAYTVAEDILRGVVETERGLEDAGASVGADARITAGDIARLLGKFAVAESLQREALASERAFLGQDHPRIARAMVELHLTLRDDGRLDEAERLLTDALAMQRRLFDGDHPDYAAAVNYLAALRRRQVRYDEAEILYTEALTMRRRLYEGDHVTIGESLNNLGLLATQMGAFARSDTLLAQSQAVYDRLLGPEHPFALTVAENRGRALWRLGRLDDAVAVGHRVVDGRERNREGDPLALARAQAWLGVFYRGAGAFDRAALHGRRAVTASRAAFDDPNQNTADFLASLGGSLLGGDQLSAASDALREAIGMYRALGAESRALGTAYFVRGELFERLGALDSAAAAYDTSLAVRRRLLGDTATAVATTAERLAAVQVALGRR